MVGAQAKVEAAEEAPLASVTQGARIKVPHQLFLTLFPKTNNPCRRTDQTTLYLNEIGHYATIAQNKCAGHTGCFLTAPPPPTPPLKLLSAGE